MNYKKMLREIKDYITALSSNAIEYTDNRLACPLYRSRLYNFGPKSVSPTSQFSYAIFTMHNLVYWITSKSVTDAINARFSLINDIGLSFRILSSIRKIYKYIN